MHDHVFSIFKVESDFGPWLAVFEDDELIFLGSYKATKKSLDADLNKFFKTHYHFDLGSFTTAPWPKKKNFWNMQHPIRMMGTPFQVQVWLKLLELPMGTCWTYTELAKKIKKPKAARAVASAVAANPISYFIPCHRVIGSGTTAASKLKYHWGSDLKAQLLKSEGVVFK